MIYMNKLLNFFQKYTTDFERNFIFRDFNIHGVKGYILNSENPNEKLELLTVYVYFNSLKQFCDMHNYLIGFTYYLGK